MGTPYAGAITFPATVTVLDDGDPPEAATWAPALEGLADRTVYVRNMHLHPVLVPVGGIPFTSLAGNFAIDFNYLNVVTSGAIGDEYRGRLDLRNGETLGSIDVFFVPDGGPRVGLPGTAPKVALVRAQIANGIAPGAPAVVATATYTPVSLVDYENGNVKTMSVTTSHLIDSDAFVYFLSITDEDGANAVVGNAYLAFRLNYS